MTVSSLPKPVIYVVGLIALVMMALLITDKTGALKLLSQKNQVRISTKPSADILFLTQPVTSISGGKIEKIEGNSIFVTQQYSYQQLQAALPSPGQPPVYPTPVTKKITYKINLGENTQINKPQPNIPYLLKQVTPAPQPKMTIKDLKVGDYISNVSTNNIDLRTLENPEFEASNISLNQMSNTISGKIEKIAGKTITIKAVPPQMYTPGGAANNQPPQEKEYSISVTSDTEISRYAPQKPITPGAEGVPQTPQVPQAPQPQSVSLEDLTPNVYITVYTNVDVTSVFKFDALRIEPQQLLSEIPTPMPTMKVEAPPPAVETIISPIAVVATTVPTVVPTIVPTKAKIVIPTEPFTE